jgi:hypothetical protein
MISCFRFGFSVDQPSIPILCSDPTELIIPDLIRGNSENGSGIADIQIRELSVDDEDVDYHKALELFELAILDTNLSLWRLLMYSEPESSDNHSDSPLLSPHTEQRKSRLPQSFIEPDETEHPKVPPANFRGYARGEDRFVINKLKRRDNEFERPAMSMQQVYEHLRNLRQPISSNHTRIIPSEIQGEDESNPDNSIDAMMKILNQFLSIGPKLGHIGKTL